MTSPETNKLNNSVRNHVRQYGTSIVTLGELMDFEWDQALFFRWPTTHMQIKESIGVDFTGPTDLVAGMIFVKNDEVVYYEIFRDAFMQQRSFDVRIQSLRRIFERDSVFEIGGTGTRTGFHWMSIPAN